MTATLYGIPTCGTCRKARAWLAESGVAYTWVDLRSSPPDEARVSAWVTTFGARALRNTSGGSYRALGLEREAWDEAQWTAAFAADPMLIKRPVLEIDSSPMAVGFSATTWSAFLEE